MNLASSILFAVIFLAFVFTAHRLMKRVFSALKNDWAKPVAAVAAGNVPTVTVALKPQKSADNEVI